MLGEQHLLAEIWPITLLMLGKAEITIPSRNEYHVIGKILPLDLGLLEYDDVSFEDIEHGLYASMSIILTW